MFHGNIKKIHREIFAADNIFNCPIYRMRVYFFLFVLHILLSVNHIHKYIFIYYVYILLSSIIKIEESMK